MKNFFGHWKLTSIDRALFLASARLAFVGEKSSIPALPDIALLGVGCLKILLGGELLIAEWAEVAFGGWAYTQAKETFKGPAVTVGHFNSRPGPTGDPLRSEAYILDQSPIYRNGLSLIR